MHTAHESRALRVLSPEGALGIEVVTVGAPGPGEARVQVLASSATLSDSVVRRGFSPYLQHLRPPFTLGYDFVGRVEALGPEVEGLEEGDRVAGLVRAGANTDWLVHRAADLTKLPRDADPLAAEVMVMSGITALQLLRVAHLAPGESVLVVGASGSVGLLGVALAKLLGASHVLGTASAGKFDLVTSQGGRAIDRHADLRAEILRVLPRGVDVILDSVGGSQVSGLGGLLAPRGRLLSFGLSGLARGGRVRTPEAFESVGRAFGEGRAALDALNANGFWAGEYDVTTSREQDRGAYDADLRWLLEQVRSGALAPVFSTHPLSDALAVHADIRAGRIRGRAVFHHLLSPSDSNARSRS